MHALLLPGDSEHHVHGGKDLPDRDKSGKFG